MATKLKEVDAVIVGLGWTGGILAKELTEAGLKVVALERGAMRSLRRILRCQSCATSCASWYATTSCRTPRATRSLSATTRRRKRCRCDALARSCPVRSSAARPCTGVVTLGAGPTWSSRSAPCTRSVTAKLHSCRHDGAGLGDHLRRARALL